MCGIAGCSGNLRHGLDTRVGSRRARYVLVRRMCAASVIVALRTRGSTSILERRKQGFGAPIDVWFRTSPRALFADVLLSARARQRGYFESRFVERLVNEHTAGRRDHAARLWALLVFELWHRRYLDARPDPIPQRPDVPVAVLS